MLSSLTLADAAGVDIPLMNDTKRAVRRASGLIGSGPVRTSTRVRPTARGGIDESAWDDGKIIDLELEASSNVSVKDAFAEFRAMKRPMTESLRTGPALMKWTEDIDGLQLQRAVKLASEVDAPLQEAAAMLVFQAQFYSEDPRAYSQTLQTFTSTALSGASGGKTYPRTYPRMYSASGGGLVSVVNGGSEPTPPVFRIYGYCQLPQIVFLGAGVRLVFTGEVGAGDYWEVNVAENTITSADGSSMNAFVDPALTTWFEIPAATDDVPMTNLQLLAQAFDGDAHLDGLLRDAH